MSIFHHHPRLIWIMALACGVAVAMGLLALLAHVRGVLVHRAAQAAAAAEQDETKTDRELESAS